MSNEKIEEAKNMVRRSEEITGTHQDALMDVLIASGKAANGLSEEDRPKAVAAAIESIGIYMARDAEHRPADFRKILREELPPLLETAFASHTKDCPIYKDWDGRERRGQPHEDAPTLSVKSKWITIAARGVKSMQPVLTVVKYLVIGGVACYAIYYIKDISQGIRDNAMVLQYNAQAHQKTATMLKEVEKEVEALKR